MGNRFAGGFLLACGYPEAVSNLLNDRAFANKLGESARTLVLERFSLEKCLPRQLSLLELVASGALLEAISSISLVSV